MQLLSQVIVADGNIYGEEISALAQGVIELGLTDASGVLLSEENIRRWFEGYLQELRGIWATQAQDVTLIHLILSLSEWPDKQAIINTLEKISLADADFHKEEKLLISIIKAYWQ
ncbi:MAG: hypothetical protein ABJN69_07670 [Hellea sp.]